MGDVPDFVDEDEADVWEGGGTTYKIEKVVGNGAFGIVWKARAIDTGEIVAIKKVLLDRRYQNRELQMLKVMDHDCVVRLKHFYEKTGRKKEETFLQLVMEYLPDTLRSVTLRYQKKRKRFPIEHIKVYMLQMLKAMEYIHSRRICHRDIKPDNLLVDATSLRLKLCDFGCSKVLVKGQPNISYICSRYYRAPELMFGATEYTCALDMWSIGTILAELLLGHLPFQGQDSTQQHLVEIMKLLGTPGNHDLQAMGASCTADDLPKLKAFPWDRVFPAGTPDDAIDLVSRLLVYNPETRLNAQQALLHPFLHGVSIGEQSAALGESPTRMRGDIQSTTSAWIEEFGKSQSSLEQSLFPSLEQSLLAGIKQACGRADKSPGAQVSDTVYNALVAQVKNDVKAANANAARQRAQTIETAQRLGQKLTAMAAEAAPAPPPAEGADGGAADRERLQASVTALTSQLDASKAAQTAQAEQLRVLQARLQEIEAERAMGSVALSESGAPKRMVAASAQTDEELMPMNDKGVAEAAIAGRRAGGRSYMSGFFSNNGIVPSPLLKRPSAVGGSGSGSGAPTGRRSEGTSGEAADNANAIMDGSANLGVVRPSGALSPSSSSPRSGAAKPGFSIGRPTGMGGSSEPSQPSSEDVVPPNRSRRSHVEDK